MAEAADQQVTYWGKELERAKKRFRTFWENGDATVDAYRLQKADGNEASAKDKYNILYSSTETIRPNLYAQQPKTRVALRNKDTATDMARVGALLLEGCIEYVKGEEDFDELMDNAVEDFLLPGLGVGWVRYEATFTDALNDGGEKIPHPNGEKNTYVQELLDEMVKMEYVYWQDFLTGVSRNWKETPWVAKRIWLNKKDATTRFGAEKADKLDYRTREATGREADNPAETAEAWEIWDKTTKTVYWWAEGMSELLDSKADPLKLKRFFPCARPMRAISNTRTFVPRALYSQYKSQAETLNVLTKRIRLLGEALRVVGLYDGSQSKLADILNPAAGNRMVAVDNWAMFAQNGGINGAVAWVPIDQIVKVLGELLKAREICKAEIYEITGLSDIIRGTSKASETLGAQNLKANWASARVKKMQKDVQRFARDMLALTGELIAEHCSPETIAIFSGLQIPSAEDIKTNPKLQQQVSTFTSACNFIKNEARRVSTIDIETDSTLMADDAQDKQDRAQFLAAAGAFLQQAVPAIEATPELGPLLGSMLMFTVRSFPSARVIEDEFEKVQQSMANRPAPDGDKDGKKAAAAVQTQKLQQDGQLRSQELAANAKKDDTAAALAQTAENNRHEEKLQEMSLRQRELDIRERELTINEGNLAVAQEDAKTRKFIALHAAGIAELGHELEVDAQVREDEREYDTMDHEAGMADADRAHEAAEGEADRQAQADAAKTAAEAAQEPPEAPADSSDA
jgi:hypothetical protein